MSDAFYVCTADCTLRAKDGTGLGPRRLAAAEVVAHDDKHVSDGARVLVRMLREVSPAVREEVLGYFTGPQPYYALLTEEPGDG
jgi:hypothetical protein